MHTDPSPSLRDVQRAMRSSIAESDARAACPYLIFAGLSPEQRVSIHRNTFVSTLAKALRLSYPAVHELVGAEFFEGAARVFAHQHPPRSSCLDLYGADFAQFLAVFEPAASLAYLADVARVEWAVNRALHAPDAQPLDAKRLAMIDSELYERIRFIADPSVSLLTVEYPADAIWRAVLAGDDAAMAAIDLADGPVQLLVQRLAAGVEIARVETSAFQITSALFAGQPLGTALSSADHARAAAVLADHLAAGRFAGFEITSQSISSPSPRRPHDDICRQS